MNDAGRSAHEDALGPGGDTTDASLLYPSVGVSIRIIVEAYIERYAAIGIR